MADLFKNAGDEEEDDMKGRFLTFQVDRELFGIELRNVMEIVGIQPITQMPEMPDYIKGIVNLRGKIIPVMDVRLRFGKSAIEYHDRTCIIVIDFDGISIGLIVDSVSEVLAIPDADIAEKPEIGSMRSRGYINNIGKIGERVILLLDCQKLLSEEELSLVTSDTDM
ncbi:MAG TPA: chemotaxis protein CheW [Candidatus Acidoferrum sp.]|nr:chemotaxis protein CheW [Candidatus Acidoferrum sp.]